MPISLVQAAKQQRNCHVIYRKKGLGAGKWTFFLKKKKKKGRQMDLVVLSHKQKNSGPIEKKKNSGPYQKKEYSGPRQ